MVFFLFYSHYAVLALLLLLWHLSSRINAVVITFAVWGYVFLLMQLVPLLADEKVFEHVSTSRLFVAQIILLKICFAGWGLLCIGSGADFLVKNFHQRRVE